MTVTLKHVAEEAGVAVSTASMALADHPRVSDRTKKRIREISVRLGYLSDIEIAARRQRSSAGLRFLFLGLGDTGRKHVRDELIMRLVANPRQTGVRMEVAGIEAEGSVEELGAQVADLARDCHGVLLYGIVSRELLEVAAQTVPIVLIGRLTKPGRTNINGNVRAASVGFSHVDMGMEATEALLEKGHRRIALVTAQGRHGLYYDGWRDGYHSAMRRAGLPAIVDPTCGYDLRAGKLPRDPDGELATAYVVPEITYLQVLQSTMEKYGQPLRPGQVVLGVTRTMQKTHQAERWPALVMNMDEMLDLAMNKLIELNGRSACRYHQINLSWSEHRLDELTPPPDV